MTVNTTIKGETKTYIFKTSTGESYEYKDPFDYGGKAKKDLVPGDDISVGTENFRVFYNQNGVIKAMLHYNLILNVNPIKQADEDTISSAGTTAFSTEDYWKERENWMEYADEIDMTDSRNLIQNYINRYKATLENFGVENIEVRAAKKSDLDPIPDRLRNQIGHGIYWIATADAWKEDFTTTIYIVPEDGSLHSVGTYYQNNLAGVRPIIIIEY